MFLEAKKWPNTYKESHQEKHNSCFLQVKKIGWDVDVLGTLYNLCIEWRASLFITQYKAQRTVFFSRQNSLQSLKVIQEGCCSTRENKTLDLFYVNVTDLYISKARPPLEKSDHKLNLPCLEYKLLVYRQPVTKRIMKERSLEAEETQHPPILTKYIFL